MGNSSSVQHLENAVFKKELDTINDMITKLVKSDDKSFVNSAYNLLDERACDNFTLVMENNLKKHLKVDLLDVKNAIYMIPKNQDIVYQGDKEYKKGDLCSMISTHYVRILKLLTLIKQVYDIENNGDYSIAGITWRNIRKKDNILEITFCGMEQRDPETSESNRVVDFSKLVGLKLLCDNYLTSVKDRNTFLAHIQSLLDRVPKEKIGEYASCDKNYNHIFKGKCKKNVEAKFNKHIEQQDEKLNLKFTVLADNPVLHDNYCGQKEKILIDVSKSKMNKNKKKVLEAYQKMYDDYIKSIKNITGIAHEFVEIKTLQLKNIDSSDLDKIENKVKKVVSDFYIQSLINYYDLLDLAKKIPNVIVTNEEVPIK